MNPSFFPFAGANIGPGAFGPGGSGQAMCHRLISNGMQLVLRIARQPIMAMTASSRQPEGVGRRCLRHDLDQREIVMRLAARKASLVGPVGRQAGPIPVKRGRRFEITHVESKPDSRSDTCVHSLISPST